MNAADVHTDATAPAVRMPFWVFSERLHAVINRAGVQLTTTAQVRAADQAYFEATGSLATETPFGWIKPETVRNHEDLQDAIVDANKGRRPSWLTTPRSDLLKRLEAAEPAHG